MKLIDATVATINAANAEQFITPNYEKDVQNFAQTLLAYAKDGVNVEQYHYLEAGNLLCDGGLVAVLAETLSLNDMHTVSQDVEYLQTACNGLYEFATLALYDAGVLVVLYLIAD